MNYALIAPVPLWDRDLQQLQLLQHQLKDTPIELWLLAKNGALLERALPMNFQHIRYIHVEDDGLTETQLQGLAACFAHKPMEGLFFLKAADSTELAIRLAMRLNGRYDSHIEHVSIHNGCIITQKTIFDGRRITQTCHQKTPLCVAMETIKKKEYWHDTPKKPRGDTIPISHYGPFTSPQSCLQHCCYMRPKSSTNLAYAEKVLLVGQGVGSAEAVAALGIWAKHHHMQLAATRAVVLNGWAKAELLVGASGQIIAPALCIAVGVSGADALYYGIRHTDYLVAINTDANAPIMGKCHLAIHGDWQLLNAACLAPIIS